MITAEQRVAKAKRQATEPRRSERESAEDREARLAGAKLRARTHAADVLTTATTLEAEGLSLSHGAKVEATEAAIELADAESKANHRGRWLLRDDRRMSDRDVLDIAGYGASVTARTINRQLPHALRTKQEDFDDFRATIALDLLSYAMRVEGADYQATPLWRDVQGKVEPDVERRIGKGYIRAANSHAEVYIGAAERAMSDAENLKGAWKALAVSCGRSIVRKRVEDGLAKKAAADPTQTRADRLREDRATATRIANMMSAEHNLSKAESTAVAAMLDGLTHRERAQLTGRTMEAEKLHAKRGRAELKRRWTTVAEIRDAVVSAVDAAQAEEEVAVPLTRDQKGELRADQFQSLQEGNEPLDPRMVRRSEWVDLLQRAEAIARRMLAGHGSLHVHAA